MPAPAKVLHVLGLMAKEEATYGTPVALAGATDGVQLQYPDRNIGAPLRISYDFDGDLGPSVASLATIKRVAQSGRSVAGPLPTRARPGGAAYSASVVPSVHRLLKAAGYDATLDATGGAEKYTYAPTAPGPAFTSLTSELYTRGEKWPVTGLISDLKIDFANPAPPIWTFDIMSILSALPTDAAVPAITYPLQAVAPPLASSIALTLGNFTSANAVVMSGGFALTRQMFPRIALSNGAAHLGFIPGGRDPLLKVVLESTALTGGGAGTAAATFNPYDLRELGLSVAVTLQFGTTQFNRYKIVCPQAQVIDAVEQNNGPIATVELTIKPFASTAVANDDHTIVFD
jgi:hypothetical protein